MSYLINPYVYRVPPYFYVAFSGPINIYKYKLDSTQITNQNWPILVDSNVTYGTGQVAIDKKQNLIHVGSRFNDINIRKYDNNGNVLLSLDSGSSFLFSCVVDSENNFIVSGNRASNITTRKYTENGTLVWSKDGTTNIWGMDIDSNDNIIFVGNGTSNRIQKYDKDGNLIFNNAAASAFARRLFVCVDDSFIIAYTGSIRKYDSGGTELWSLTLTGDNYMGLEDGEGNIIVVSDRTSNLTTRKYNSSRTLLWSRDHGAAVWYAVTDKDNNIYTIGQRTSNLTTRKYSPDGTLLWSLDIGTAGNGRSIAINN